jgi:hypothetical protein
MHGSFGSARSALVLCVVCWGQFAAIHAGEPSPQTAAAGDAAQLVQAALDAELAGDGGGRDELLAQAIAADPEYGPARWHSGQVQFDGQWRSVTDAYQRAATDSRWADYQSLRDSLDGGAVDHEALAEYCREHGLANEERFHWAVVLLDDPSHETARTRLGLREYRGELYTHDQIAQIEQGEKTAQKNLRRFKPGLTKLCRAATSDDPQRSAAALADVRAIADPDMFDALALAARQITAKSERHAPELYLAIVDALTSSPTHDATLRLLDLAVFSPWDEVRRGASLALRTRPPTDYVPLLMGGLTAPIEVRVDLFAAPDGTVRLVEEIFQAGPEGDHAHLRSTHYETENPFATREQRRPDPALALASNLAFAGAVAERTQAQADSANAAAEAVNRRLEEVVRIAVGIDGAADPEVMWQAWQDFNELSYSDEDAVFTTYEETTYMPMESHSCFAPGTPVWTQSGPVAIEYVAVGDLVLAQHPVTGEVAFRPVLQTTLGEPIRVIRIQFRDETIVATRGHRFWVNGRGWEMAKFLDASAGVHALGGAIDVGQIEEIEPIACHNLVVDEFHTFFVGESQLLVHDKTCPEPTFVSIPGSATLRSELPEGATAQLTLLGN